MIKLRGISDPFSPFFYTLSFEDKNYKLAFLSGQKLNNHQNRDIYAMSPSNKQNSKSKGTPWQQVCELICKIKFE